MAKFNNATEATMVSYFNAGDQPTEAQFTALMAAIQAAIDEHDHVGVAAGDGLQALGSTAGPLTITMANAGCHILDTGNDHDLIITPGTNLTADCTLTLTTGDVVARTITLSGNPTLADWFDQSVKAAASPTFADVFTTNGGVVGISGNERIEFYTAGYVNVMGAVLTCPSQPAFNVRIAGADQSFNAGAYVTITFDSEIFDTGADYNVGTYTFTAPRAGKYLLTAMVNITNVDTAASYYQLTILTSTEKYSDIIDSRRLTADPGHWSFKVTAIVNMTAGHTAVAQVKQIGGANQSAIDSDPEYSRFMGWFLG